MSSLSIFHPLKTPLLRYHLHLICATLRLQLALIAMRNMVTKQMDVTAAFLNGVPEEILHMQQPPGYEDTSKPDWVCLLLRNLYGLKQASRVWHLTIDPFIKSLGFQANQGDPCLYFRWDDGKLTMVTLHVDDLTLASDSQSILDQVSSQLKAKFTMTDDGEISNVLKLSIERNLSEKKIYIHQHSYLNDLLIRFNMADSHQSRLPWTPSPFRLMIVHFQAAQNIMKWPPFPIEKPAVLSWLLQPKPGLTFSTPLGLYAASCTTQDKSTGI
jgi:hypothetical protein